MSECQKCRGTGKCTVCGGSGRFNEKVVSFGSSYRAKDICPFCKGEKTCGGCQGTGTGNGNVMATRLNLIGN